MLTFNLKKEWFEIDRKKLKEKLQNLPKKNLKKLLAFAETGDKRSIMNFKKYKKLELQLREVEGEQKTKERMKYFYNTTKEMYQQQYHKLSCDLGVCLAEKSKLEEKIKNIVPELEKVNNIIDNLELTLDLDKYIEINKLMKKPVKKSKFTKELLNTDIILSYLVNTIKTEDYLKIKDILLKEVK